MSGNIDIVFLQKLAFKMAMVLLIIGALNWLIIGITRVNPVEFIAGKGFVSRSIYIIVGIAALTIMFNRDTYLPFLGETVMPCTALVDRVPPGASKAVKVSAPPGAKILYWASEPAMDGLKQINDWHAAYVKYENAGVTTADTNGLAILKVRSPQAYTVPFKGRLEAHVHYRVCGDNGLVGRVNTVFVDSGKMADF